MIVEFDRSFSKSIEKLKNSQIKKRVSNFIEELERAESVEQIRSVKKMDGDSISYRKRIGNYRVGFELKDNIITLIIVAHRKDIYKRFP